MFYSRRIRRSRSEGQVQKLAKVMVQSLLPSNDHLSAQPFINNCYSEMCMSSGAVGKRVKASHTYSFTFTWPGTKNFLNRHPIMDLIIDH
ncbi:hypothetical protein NECAME_12553 [Necator americanus]|uniref:Uncharacterized protein n=1 Tax=Necator americanus TaxID=51031 RepID=W2T1A1_NECAM|nr:hypothetical protein NECAME_12553 [Necator americanus]ETN75031.1 hypothetical protein NECAME_12553 [Necator americanus]